MQRQRLPNRRRHEVFDFVFSRGSHDPAGTRYTAGVGRTEDGTVYELFLDCAKLSSAMTDDARDIAVTLSIAIQHGVPLTTIRDALTQLEAGQPAGLAGRLLQELAVRVPEAFTPAAKKPPPDAAAAEPATPSNSPAGGSGAAALLHVPCPICSGVGDMSTDDGHRQNDKDTCTSCGGLGQVLARTGETSAAAFDPAETLPLQQGRV